jgi:two-component sensor histidine kinase
MTAIVAAAATTLELPGIPASVPAARAFVFAVLEGGSAPAGPVAVCTSELITNAIIHTRSGAPGGTAVLSVGTDAGAVTIAVGDQGAPGAPAPAAPASGAEHGYGLAIVATLADAWGTYEADGRRWVWCRFGGES